MTIQSDMPADVPREVPETVTVSVPQYVHLRFARDMSMNLARQSKLAGDTKGMREHLGYAVYWHVRVMHPLLSVEAASIRAHERGKRFGVRAPEAQRTTLVAAVAGMNKLLGETA